MARFTHSPVNCIEYYYCSILIPLCNKRGFYTKNFTTFRFCIYI